MGQAAATELLEKLHEALSAKFPPKKVDEVIFHYTILRKAARLDQYEQCLVNGGKFVEAVLKCLHFLSTGEEVDSVNVDLKIRQLENVASLSVSEKMTIPRTLRAIYELRSKRGGAHNFSFDPLKMDCAFVVAASNWVMEELTRLYLTNDPAAAQALVESLLTKNVSLIEEIDGDYLILKPGLSARVQLEILLYQHAPNRCQLGDLIRWLHTETAANVRTTLRALKQKNLVHEAEGGWKLTESGIQEAESELAKIQDQDKGGKAKQVTKPRTKGGKNGRRRVRTIRTVLHQGA